MLPAGAADTLCAFRDGPRGPCTCKTAADGPGQFTVVAKRRCRTETKAKAPSVEAAKAPPSGPASEAQAREQPSAESAAAEGVTPITTGALPSPSAGTSRLDQIRARGKLICGVGTGLLGFSAQTEAGDWSGIDVAFCQALAAAVLGDASKTDFVPLETNERFEALRDGKIDVLSRNTTWTMAREVDMGLRFAGTLYFDGQGFMTRGERGLVSAQQLGGSKVCVEAGTTSEVNMAFYFKTHQIEAEIMSLPTREEMVTSYERGSCDTVSGDRSGLYALRATLPDPTQHDILPEVISKEPLGPAVLKEDDEWAEITRWTLAGLVNAEEVGLDRASAAASDPLSGDAERLVQGAGASGEKLRLGKTWLRDVVAASGNYGEIFDRNVGKGSPLGMERGLNALWKRGGLLSAPPMW